MTNEAIAGIVADRFRDDAARLGATPADRALIESAAYLAALAALEHAEGGAPDAQPSDGKPAALFRAGTERGVRVAADWLIGHAGSDVEDCEACFVYAEGGGDGYCPVHYGVAQGVDTTLEAARQKLEELE